MYIPSGITGLYEKYGFQKIDVLMNYGGDTDNIFYEKLLEAMHKVFIKFIIPLEFL